MSSSIRRTLKILSAMLAALVVAGAIYWHSLAAIKSDYFAERPGLPETVSITPVESQPTEIVEDVTLGSSSGLLVEARVRRPVASKRLPIVVIIGGHRTGRRATDLVDGLAGIAFVAIDYPYRGDVDIYGVSDALGILPGVQRALIDTPPALVLTLRWLLQQDWVDTEQIEIAGVSLGVPFAAAAAAQDAGFSRLWLVHGALDNQLWVDYALRRHIDNEWLRRTATKTLLHLVNGASFDTSHWIRDIRPRPVVVISATNDERVPASANDGLGELVDEGLVEVIATEGRHVDPGRERLLAELLRVVKSRVNLTAAERRAR